MRRFFLLLTALSLLLTSAGCSAGLTYTETKEPPRPKAEETVTETETEEELPPLPDTWPEGFTVGYNRQSIAPKQLPIVTYAYFNHTGYSNHDPVQLTCTALCDGVTPVLLFSIDLRGVPSGFVDYSTKLIEQATGVPKEHVFINATHTHSAPDNSHFGEGPAMLAWMKLYYERLVRCATLALCDLAPAQTFVGTAHSDGVTFVRRYLLPDGRYETNPGGNVVEHESQPDTEMRVIRFQREEGKKDVIMVNFQTHYHGTFATSVSADFVHPFREQMEKDLDCHFVYHNGASGNINFRTKIPGELKYDSLEKAAAALVEVAKEANSAAYPVSTGPIYTQASYYRPISDPSLQVRLYAFGMGDLAFCSAPYEMFDTNGVWIRENSPYEMTFVCAYTNGHMGYCPSALAWPHGAYEVNVSPFYNGAAEEFAAELVRELEACRRGESS